MAETKRSIARRRGYMAIDIRERGNVPRKMKKAFNNASKSSWFKTGKYFHVELREDRFTPAHAKAAKYAKRKGEGIPPGTKKFARSYYGRKLNSPKLGGGPNMADPLTYTGKTKRAIRSSSISSTSKSTRIRYPGANTFNFRHPKSKIRMNEEFRRITQPENVEIAEAYDRNLDSDLKDLDR